MNVTDCIARHAADRPEEVAVVDVDDTSITYRMLDRLIDRCGLRALREGLVPGQIVALGMGAPDEALGLVAALGLARAGIASADPQLAAQHLAAALLPSGGAREGVRTILLDRSWVEGGDERLATHPGGDVTLRVFATSGTSGKPRFCAVTHAAMLQRNSIDAARIIATGTAPVQLCALGIGGSAGMRVALSALELGGTVVFTTRHGAVNAMLRHRVTSLAASPRTLQQILEQIPEGVGPLPSLRIVQVSGSHLPAKLGIKAIQRLCPNIVTTLGATETGRLCAGRFGEFAHIPLAIGQLDPAVEAEVVDEDDTALPPGAEGRLRVRATGMVDGYFDDAAATAAAFRGGWFYSGDRGSIDGGRVVRIFGRSGDVINSGGVKTDPRVIEAALLSIPEVEEAVAFGAPDADGLPQIWAAVVATVPLAEERLNRQCVERLGVRAPKFVLQMRELPRNGNGKVVTGPLLAIAARHYASSVRPRVSGRNASAASSTA